MVVPTLPGIGIVPHFMFFYILEQLALVFVSVFLVAATVSSCVLACLLVLSLWRRVIKGRTLRQCGPSGCRSSCCGYMKTVFLSMGRLLCVNTFPALFKMHKTRSDRGSQTRSFMVFLDRNVESSLALIAAFSSIVFSIFCMATTVFLRYFPVEKSEECLEKDSHGRSLFCYSNSSNSSLPVDCAEYSVTELRELHFDCYAIAVPAGLGIAVAAALGLAKVAIVGITIYVKVIEAFYKFALNQIGLWRCCGSKKRGAVIISSGLLLLVVPLIVSILIWFVSLTILIDVTDLKVEHLYYAAYMFLSLLISLPLGYIMAYLATHCQKGEYVSFAADQRPPDPHDWDVESESSMTTGQQDEAITRGENGNVSACGVAPNETVETELCENNGDTKYHTTQA